MNTSEKKLSLLLKMIVVISGLIGIIMSASLGQDSFMGGTHVFMFFTIQSNIAILLIAAYGAAFMLRNKPLSNLFYLIQFVGTVSITLTGMVFCFVLAPTLGNYAWGFSNVLTHVVVPLAAVIDFFVSGIEGNVQPKNVWLVTLPPLAYALYAGIGYIAGWEFLEGVNYPYFFLNWGSPAGAFGFTDTLPFLGCVWWILLLLLFLVLVGRLYLFRLDLRRKNRTPAPAEASQA